MMFDKFACNAVTVGLRITDPSFAHLALPWSKQVMAKKMQELWNNQTSCYRDHLTKCESVCLLVSWAEDAKLTARSCSP